MGFWAALGRPEPQNDRFSIKSLNTPLLTPREIALELVSGADFWCKLMCGAGPVDLRGSRGPRGPPGPRKRTIFNQIQNPPLLNSREIALELVSGADFLCKLMSGAGPADLRGVPGAPGPPRHRKRPIFSQIQSPHQLAPSESGTDTWVPEGSLAKKFRAGSPGF